MIDIYFLQTILNIIWTIFSILFVLYRFTTFFSYILNFIKFLGKITNGILYVKNQVSLKLGFQNNSYTQLPESSNTVKNKTVIQHIKSKFSSLYRYISGNKYQQVDLEMCTTSIYDPSVSQNRERATFEEYFDNLVKENHTQEKQSLIQNHQDSSSDDEEPPQMFFSAQDNNDTTNFKEFVPFGDPNALFDSRMIYNYLGHS